MQSIITNGLTLFYAFMGVFMLYLAIQSFKTIQSNKKFGTTLFWVLMSVPFIIGEFISPQFNGVILVLCSLLTVSKQVILAELKQPDENYATKQASKLGNKIFLPSLILAFAAIIVSSLLMKFDGSSPFSIGIGSLVAVLFALYLTKTKSKEALDDGVRLFNQIGPAGMLPQLLVSLGALFTASGVGNVISNLISGVIPENSRLFGVVAYVLGMVIFTMIMGNAFAAFSVITAGIGVPFVLSQGGNPALIGALALTAGYCGTLLTPMAANFNIIPVALLEMKNNQSVIKAQAPVAIILIFLHIGIMYFLGF
jgi:uncharacterized membrane protein